MKKQQICNIYNLLILYRNIIKIWNIYNYVKRWLKYLMKWKISWGVLIWLFQVQVPNQLYIMFTLTYCGSEDNSGCDLPVSITLNVEGKKKVNLLFWLNIKYFPPFD